MAGRKNIFIIVGSAASHSANERLVNIFATETQSHFDVTIFNSLKTLPHFDPDLSIENPPLEIIHLRKKIADADGIIICTPEYVFSIPSGLKNALEWCVSTTIFSGKPVGLITASAQGKKGHEELQLIMQTLMATFTADTTILISGIKGKINKDGDITDGKTKEDFKKFIRSFKDIIERT